MKLEKIISISKTHYTGPVYNLEIEPTHPVHDDQFYVNAHTGLVVHNCHPRDNIALRYLADRLDLGYDLFDAIMKAREVQAERMAKRCMQNGTRITIVGKAYKPDVPFLNGSGSLLVGHYIEQLGGEVNYYDENTGDLDLRPDWTEVYLIGYWDENTAKLKLPHAATVIDPWRRMLPEQHYGPVIHYGNTRKKNN